ncbi:hypothetical protein BV25DRAFT_1908757 [Artomyces pyxidatus]|uniref:Uncharacterized protein n=1 Tax=Artomyces pyxidatus TaxID=48021 RepID=A0ACB8SSX0_9AGAM|nr:hypothetical protein BV25DRAFT_1908757 [Artomyces pyxidatus]
MEVDVEPDLGLARSPTRPLEDPPTSDTDPDDSDVDNSQTTDDLLTPQWEPPVSLGLNPSLRQREAAQLSSNLEHVAVAPSRNGTAAVPPPAVIVHPSAYEEYLQRLEDLSGPSMASAPNPYAPFTRKMDWDVAHWAKFDGPGANAFTKFLGIEGMLEKLELSYRNSPELNEVIDKKIPSRPQFKREEIVVAGEAFDVYFRDVMECVKALYADAEFAPYLVFKPERHYQDKDQTKRLFHDMHTGRWWWDVQDDLEAKRPGATIIPIIISSDKTQLTLFRNKAAYPIYMTIGNIPKDIRRKPSRRAQVLLGYLPTSRLDHITNDAARRRALGNLFHACMSRILAPIKGPGIHGVEMTSGDGATRRCHPIFAIFVGDYPEQCLVACTKQTLCPKGTTPNSELGDDLPDGCPARDLNKVLDALQFADGDPVTYNKECEAAGIKPVYKPFWEDLPYANVFLSITPDVLHQLYQGVMKHAIFWLRAAFGDEEIDARCRRMPQNHNLRLFTKGICHLSRVSGTEHRDICRILLGLVVDLPLPNNESHLQVIEAVRALLDFLYLAQFPVKTTATLAALRASLTRFHTNKDIFIELGIRDGFLLPKLHALCHYVDSITLFGTTDNYNTEQSERLHIDFTKDAYRATNKKDEYPQMTAWIERREKMMQHAHFIHWRVSGQPVIKSSLDVPSPAPMHIKMTKHPSEKAVSIARLISDYGAVDFSDALADFIVSFNNPQLNVARVRTKANNLLIPFQKVPVFHKIKFWNHRALLASDGFSEGHMVTEAADVAHVRPAREDKRGRTIPGRFDTVLVRTSHEAMPGSVKGFRVAQVRAVISLPLNVMEDLFPRPPSTPPQHLAYVEWFTAFSSKPEDHHGLYKISRAYRGDRRHCAVIPVDSIYRSVHLLPKFGPVAPREWTSFNVLEECEHFYVNSFTDRHTYLTFGPAF